MLIELDYSLLACIEDFSQTELDGLINLAIAAREGLHYLVAPRALADSLSKNNALGERERALYKTIYERYSTLAGMVTRVEIRIRVARHFVAKREQKGNSYEIQMPLSFFSSVLSIHPPILLCENLADCKLMYEFARAYANSEHLSSVRTKLDLRPGGGSTTADAVDLILKEGLRLLLAAVDSDKSSPDAPLGDTAKRVKRVFSRYNLVSCELIVLGARELENLLPDDFYRAQFGTSPDHCASVEFLTALSDHDCSTARLHIDVKVGLSLRTLLEPSDQPTDFDSVWGVVVDRVAADKLPCPRSCIVCAKARTCLRPQECTCVLTTANSSSILDLGAGRIGREGKEWWRTLPDHLKAPTLRLARAVFDWGCAGQLSAS